MKVTRRVLEGVISGAVLGIFCIIGGSSRAGGFSGNELYLIGLWYNRVIMGLLIALSAQWEWTAGRGARYGRAAVLGFAVSLAFFLSTDMRDLLALMAGVVYGLIIEAVVGRRSAG